MIYLNQYSINLKVIIKNRKELCLQRTLFIKVFFYGATLGFIAGIIYAPKTGNETREILGENIKDWKIKANDLVDSAKERLNNAVQEGVEESKRSRQDLYDE